MCVSKECSNGIMAAAKDDESQEITDQDEPSSTCAECAFCILSILVMTMFADVLCQIFLNFPAESLKLS